MKAPKPPPLATTGIGSLPHTQLELALQHALAQTIPFLPQLPRRDPAEYMIPQALHGLPGLRYDAEGNVTIEAGAWERYGAHFNARLDETLEKSPTAFAPASTGYAAFAPFLWEIEDRALPFAKAQLAGPTTVRWAVRLDDGRRATEVPELDRAIYRLLLARALAMVHAIRERGATPIFFFDEPGLYALDVRDGRHVVHLQELRIAFSALQRAGALTGLHCCSNTAWNLVLGLGMDYLSIDVALSLAPLARFGEELRAFAHAGGRLALGIVPTNQGATYDLEELVARVLSSALEVPLSESLVTPACGLALRSIPECEAVFGDVKIARQELQRGIEAR
jgi:methionine synthase II (cobalamin-independent)